MRIIIAAAVAVALGAAAPAMAQTDSQPSYSGIYGGLGWSGTDAQGLWTHSITGRVGGRYGKYVGVEGEISGGLSTDHYTFAPGTTSATSVGVKQSLAGAVYGVGFLPLSQNFDLLARIGYGASRFNLSPSGLSSYHDGEHGLRYGAGAQYFIGKNGLRVDWTRQDQNNFTDAAGYYPPGDRHADVYAVTFAHKF